MTWMLILRCHGNRGEIVRTLSNVQVSRCSEQLLSILEALLLVDPDSGLWAALEQLAEQAVLLSHDCKTSRSNPSSIK